MVPGEDQRLLCAFCGTSFGEVTRICPQCGHYNEQAVRHCSQCGQQLSRDCPACGAKSWILADHCVQCGRNLDLINQMAQRWHHTTQQRLAEHRAGMAELKAEQERASRERMASFLQAEQVRREALWAAQAAQRQRDRQMYVLVAVGLVLFIVFVLLILLLAPGGG
jgi:uncharacterized membrane protein YvbJ